MSERALDQLKPGEKGKVVRVSGGNDISRRLLAMGVIKGAGIEVERAAPLGDPIEVRIKSYHLSFRKEEAANIIVEVD